MLSLNDFIAEPSKEIDLAINIHSWNECPLSSIAGWLEMLSQIGVEWLFTVSNGQITGGRAAYSSWGGNGESFRPLIEVRYNLITEESLGLSDHPHALWQLK